MKKEVLARIGAASQTYSAMQRTIFKNRHLGTRVRLQLFDSLVLSQLFYGMSTWSSLGAGLLDKVDSFVTRCQRAICNFDRTKTNDEFRGLYQLPRIDVRLATTRLLYVSLKRGRMDLTSYDSCCVLRIPPVHTVGLVRSAWIWRGALVLSTLVVYLMNILAKI